MVEEDKKNLMGIPQSDKGILEGNVWAANNSGSQVKIEQAHALQMHIIASFFFNSFLFVKYAWHKIYFFFLLSYNKRQNAFFVLSKRVRNVLVTKKELLKVVQKCILNRQKEVVFVVMSCTDERIGSSC